MRLRRRRCLVCYWHEGTFVAHPYPGALAVTLPTVGAEILSAFDEWTSPERAGASLKHLDGTTVVQAVTALREHGLLLEENSAEADRDARIAHQWRSWEPEASFFHYATQDTHTAESLASLDPLEVGKLPALFTTHPDADRILLPRYPADLTAPLGETLYSRRTHRDFNDAPVALPTLAALLQVCFAPVDYLDAGELGAVIRRTSPAGGARQELDPYLAITNVTGVPAGMYHYNSLEHSLELLSEGFTHQDAADLCAGQDHFGGAAFLVILVAVIERMRVKYRSPRCYRVSLLGAGHLGQTFALTATALGLGPFQTGAFHDAAVVERLSLDNTSRTPVYVLGAGHPNPEPDPERSPASAGFDAFHRTPLT
ncbi:SagB/ThcOx family dehydrogenase [Streptomyces sp. NPDC002073]|uniref:SagB/ThcOx family dehydrogenase n=1 Tax=Streptomyces sp. NBC_00239 TaxID=2903640 RepID=UPI002E2A519F|nr:SagB/ThcOx family dehydrogenase [Streptomyces sp. NBC_00239]